MRYGRVLFLLLGLAATPAWSQFPQYIAPGSLVIPRVDSSARALEGYNDSRWELGDVHLSPLFSFAGPSYINNVFSVPDDQPQQSDIRITLGLGLASYVHFGPKIIGSIYVMPGYVWWNELEELRETNGDLAAGLFGYFNRLALELTARSGKLQRSLSSEFEVPVSIRTDTAELAFEVDIKGPISTFGLVLGSRIRYSEPGDTETGAIVVANLDRDESVADLGLRYTLRSGLAIGLGLEYSKAEFVEDLGGRSNSGTSPLLTVGWSAPRFDIDIAVVRRQLEFVNDPNREDFTETTGTGLLNWNASQRLSLALYGARTLIYSVLDRQGLSVEERIGFSVASPLVRRLNLRVWIEVGSNDFESTEQGTFSRVDDFLTYGGSVEMELTQRFSLLVRAGRTDWDSNVPGFDRSVSRLEANFGIGSGSLPW